MKNTSILTYTAVASLTAFLVSLTVTQDPFICSAMFAATGATLIALHDYSPRRYFVITSQSTRAPSVHPWVAHFPKSLGARRYRFVKRRISVLA